jgi:hypothetical protein
MGRAIYFVMRQVALVGLAVIAYFGVRGLTEGDLARARDNAGRLLDLEQLLRVDFELEIQQSLTQYEWLVTAANWVYIWGHWPVVIGTLVWLAIAHREVFYELRNAMFISGAIGLLIFSFYAVAPPRLFAMEYIDTVTIRSISYRVLQPPQFVNKYAAFPSLHVGWNLLVGVAWAKATKSRWMTGLAILMPSAMAFSVVATANHWTLDVVFGAAVALSGLYLERLRQRHSPAMAKPVPAVEKPRSVQPYPAATGGDRLVSVPVKKQSTQ